MHKDMKWPAFEVSDLPFVIKDIGIRVEVLQDEERGGIEFDSLLYFFQKQPFLHFHLDLAGATIGAHSHQLALRVDEEKGLDFKVEKYVLRGGKSEVQFLEREILV